jgi:hypothetical protein
MPRDVSSGLRLFIRSVKLFLRSFLPLLLGLLASCTVYDKVFHPYRLPTPDMTAEAKAKFRASEKARHKGTVLKTEEISTNATDTDAAGGSPAKTDNKLTYKELPAGTRVKYDKELLLKKPKLKRRRYHHYDTRPLTPRKASRENRRLRHHSKGKGTDSTRQPAEAPNTTPPSEGAPPRQAVPTPPDAAPAPKSPKVKAIKEPKVKEPKAKKSKVPVPKPDPTQERPDK